MPLSRKSLFKIAISKQAILSIVGFLIIVLISIPLAKNVSKQYRVNKEIDSLRSEITDLGSKNSQLKDLISYMQSDQFVDEKARLNLNYKQPGESVVVVNDKTSEQSDEKKFGSVNVDTSKDYQALSENNNFKKWSKYFLKK